MMVDLRRTGHRGGDDVPSAGTSSRGPLDSPGTGGQGATVPIEFFDLLDDDGWEPRPLDPSAPGARWSEGGALADAPVDVAATFDGARWIATAIDPTFGLTGIRLRADFTVPRHHHDQQVLRIVFGGTLTVRADDAEVELRTGEFCTIDGDLPHALTAGPGGVTYTESWHLEAPDVTTTWHPDPAWATR